MTIWGKIAGAVTGASVGGPVGVVAGAIAGHVLFDRVLDDDVAFTIALISLSAKMAKVDGDISLVEVAAFYQICQVPEGEQRNVARIYRLTQEDTTGYEVYARQVARLFADNRLVCEDVLDALLHIAYADGDLHPAEQAFINHVGEIFGFTESEMARIQARHTQDIRDPYMILGITPEANNHEVKAAWLDAVRQNHPDQLQARGVPPEIIHLTDKRMAAINQAWEAIRQERQL